MSSDPIPWLTDTTPFPPAGQAWPIGSDAPGLLAAGANLSVPRLLDAYRNGIFPWFSEGQPILWWSTNPRMVLATEKFRVHKSFAKTLRRFINTPGCEIHIDRDFTQIVRHCAHTARAGQQGSWIVPEMQLAYTALHHSGYAHSVEVWQYEKLIGGLYCVAIGKAVFGESMFSLQSGASKIALAALVGLCRNQGCAVIDCQQETRYLQSLGARPQPREDFLHHVSTSSLEPPMNWEWMPLYWNTVVTPMPRNDRSE